MRVPRQAIIAIVLTVVLGGGYLIERAKEASQSVLSGSFETQPALLSSRVQGRVKSIPAKEGDFVRPGETLAVLEAGPDVQDTRALEEDLHVAERTLREAELEQKEQVLEQQDVVRQLQAELEKAKNGNRPQEIAEAKANLANADAKLLETIRGPRPQEILQSKAALAASEANLAKVLRGGSVEQRAKLQADLETAQASEAEAKLTYERRRVLFQEDAISAEAADDAKADYVVAETKRRSAEDALRDLNSRPEDIALARHQVEQNRQSLDLLLAGSRVEDIQAARAARDQAAASYQLMLAGSRSEDIADDEAKLSQAKETLKALQGGSRNQTIAEDSSRVQEARSKFLSSRDKSKDDVIRTIRPAKVERVLVAEGELLAAGTGVLRVSYPDDLHLRIYIPEQDLAKVHVGDHAQLQVDGISGMVDCLVESVASEGEFTPANLQTPEDRGKQVFTVRMRPAQIDARLKAGMSATVRQIGTWRPE